MCFVHLAYLKWKTNKSVTVESLLIRPLIGHKNLAVLKGLAVSKGFFVMKRSGQNEAAVTAR